MQFVDFRWFRDPFESGWHLTKEMPALPVPSSSVDPRGEAGTLYLATYTVGISRQPARIVYRGSGLQSYRPLEHFPKLFETFSKVITPEDLLSFVKRFGPLTHEGVDGRGDNVEHLLPHAKQVRILIDAYVGERRREIAAILGPKGIPLAEAPIGDVRVEPVFDPATGTLRLQFVPRNLLNAIWFKLAEYLGGNPNLAECPYCGQRFERGRATGLRSDAKFCSEPHRIAFNSKNRKPASSVGSSDFRRALTRSRSRRQLHH
jgi:hypothetical protein